MADLSNFLLATVIIAAFVLMFCGCIAIIFVSPGRSAASSTNRINPVTPTQKRNARWFYVIAFAASLLAVLGEIARHL
ncbi:hypothetical protein [Ralstonia insidiosa]|uniref:Transmembrane protein n=1 Tax=Ralstonia insidiosa TaxID=190721 RepID=A0A848NQ14_9RALS|nr:hypothetical protein [Ralstonia insidiosa]NMV37212.1 hypothetical protein [Ralstonia insidiosa]